MCVARKRLEHDGYKVKALIEGFPKSEAAAEARKAVERLEKTP